MAKNSLCSIPDCDKLAKVKGFCRPHYRRTLRGTSSEKPLRPAPGSQQAFVAGVINSATDECILWPFAKNRQGYGKYHDPLSAHPTTLAHRYVCAAVNGPPPPQMQAAHSCGNGHLGCVNPRHLRWATAQENADDRRRHGHNLGGESSIFNNKLSKEDVLKIRTLIAAGHLQKKEIATLFGVSPATITEISSGQTWGWLP